MRNRAIVFVFAIASLLTAWNSCFADDIVWKTIVLGGVNYDVHVVSSGALGANFPNAALQQSEHKSRLTDIYVVSRATNQPVNKPLAKNLVTLTQSSFKRVALPNVTLNANEIILDPDIRHYLSSPYPLEVPSYFADWWVDSFVRGGMEGTDRDASRAEIYRQILFDVMLQPDAVPDGATKESAYQSLVDRLTDIQESEAALGTGVKVFEFLNDDKLDYSSFKTAVRTFTAKVRKLADLTPEPPERPTPLARLSTALGVVTTVTKISGESARILLLESLAHERGLQRIRILEALIGRAKSAGGQSWDPMLESGFNLAKQDVLSYIDSWYDSLPNVLLSAAIRIASDNVVEIGAYFAKKAETVLKVLPAGTGKVLLPYELSWQVAQGIRRQKNRAASASLAATLQRQLFKDYGLKWLRDRMRPDSRLDSQYAQDYLELYQMQWYLGYKFYRNTFDTLGNKLTYLYGVALDFFSGANYRDTLDDLESQLNHCLVVTKRTAPTGYLATTREPDDRTSTAPELTWLLGVVRDVAPPAPIPVPSRDMAICITNPNDIDGNPQTPATADASNIYFVPYPCSEDEGQFTRNWDCTSADADGSCQSRVQLFYDNDTIATNAGAYSGPWPIEGAEALNPRRDSPFLWRAENQGINRGQFYVYAVISDGKSSSSQYSSGYFDFDFTPIYEAGTWEVSSTEVSESRPSDGDGIPEIGEDVEVWVTLRHHGPRTLRAPRLREILLLDDSVRKQTAHHDDRVNMTEVVDGKSNFADAPPAQALKALDPIRLHLAPDTSTTIDMISEVRYLDDGASERPGTERRQVVPFTVRVSDGTASPAFSCREVVVTSDDDNDGVFESGEGAGFHPVLCNDGTWTGTNIEGVFDPIPELGTWSDDTGYYPSLASGACAQSRHEYGLESAREKCGDFQLAMTVNFSEGGPQYPVYCPIRVTCVARQSIEDEVNAGTVTPGTRLNVSIGLWSVGATTLHVTSAVEKNHAADTVIDDFPRTLAPGSAGSILAHIDTTGLVPGRYTRTIRTESDADNTDERESVVSFAVASASGSTQVSFNGLSSSEIDISGDYAVLVRNGDVYCIRLSTKEETNITNSSEWSEYEPRIDGSYIVFGRRVSPTSESNIFLYDLGSKTETQITDDPTDQFMPDVRGSTIVWEDRRAGKVNAKIYKYVIGVSSRNGELLVDLGARFAATSPKIEDRYVGYVIEHYFDPSNDNTYYRDLGYVRRQNGQKRSLGLEGNAVCTVRGDFDVYDKTLALSCECPACDNDDQIYRVDMDMDSAISRMTCDATLTSDRRHPAIRGQEVLYFERSTADVYSVANSSGCQSEIPRESAGAAEPMKNPVADPRTGSYAFVKTDPTTGRDEVYAYLPPPAIDAAVATLEFDAGSFTQEGKYSYHVKVRNEGTDALGNFGVSVSSDGSTFQHAEYAGLAVGASLTIDGVWSTAGLSIGSHRVRAFLDSPPTGDGRIGNDEKVVTNAVGDDDTTGPIVTDVVARPEQGDDGDPYLEAGESVEFRWTARDPKGIAETHVVFRGVEYPGAALFGDVFSARAPSPGVGVFDALVYATDADDVGAGTGPVTASVEVFPAAPAVASTSPASDEAGVSRSTTVLASFSEDMIASSITSESFYLSARGGGSRVEASVSYDAASRVATLIPSEPLSAGTLFDAVVVGGSGGVRDIRQNVMVSDYKWSFSVLPNSSNLATRLVDFGPGGTPPTVGYERDAGRPFSNIAGLGWIGANSALESRARAACSADTRKSTFVFSRPERTWEIQVANGDYEIEVSVGDCANAQGPQRVTVEDVSFVDGESTAAGRFIVRSRTVPIRDGRVSITIGGTTGYTTLNYVTIRPAESQPAVLKSINFQPQRSRTPDSFSPDCGGLYGAASGYGWDRNMEANARERGREGNGALDTFIYAAGTAATFEMSVPNGLYDVSLAVGDASFPQGPHRVVLEGRPVIGDEMTTAGLFIRRAVRVYVGDGRLTMRVGGSSGNTMVNYLVVSSAPAATLSVNFQPDSSVTPVGYRPDSGQSFDLGRGYGWLGSPVTTTRERNHNTDRRLDTFVFISTPARSWEASLPSGDYEVECALGDPDNAQGPHWLDIEGTPVTSGERTEKNRFLVRAARVPVRDGKLTIRLGGGANGNSVLNYVVVRPAAGMVEANFQPPTSAVPPGMTPDSGRIFDWDRRYGWNSSEIYNNQQSRERNFVADQALDTFVYTTTVQQWRAQIPNGNYTVTVAVGDAAYAQGPQRVVVEGTVVVNNEVVPAGQFLVRSRCVAVSDGTVTIDAGGGGGNTTIDYVRIFAGCNGTVMANAVDESVSSYDSALADWTELQ